ncbi:MAG TPA: sigma-70 family RNA polymerase sigma factor [Terriglobia bacterium]|nr:sigma-70 family RNA polymerase sigma factor [Terriglobia bacterium]
MSTAPVLKDIQRNLAPEFEKVFREHHAFVYRTAYGVTGRVEDADDVVQTVFLRLLRREFPPDLTRNPRAYLYRAAFNAAVSVLRARRRNAFENVEEVETPATPPMPGVDEDTCRELYDAIAELRPTSAQILILRYVHDYDLVEIAKTLGTTRGSVAVSLFRSRARLKKKIREMRAKP